MTTNTPSGAVDANALYDAQPAGRQWFVDVQRTGADSIENGVRHHSTDAIDAGLRVCGWAWNKQQPDGSWLGMADGYDWQAFHGGAVFAEAAAGAVLALKASPFAARYAAQITDYTERLGRAARWLTGEPQGTHGRAHNAPFTHRRWMLAACLAQIAALHSNDPALLATAAEYARDGLSLQLGTDWWAALLPAQPAVLLPPGTAVPLGAQSVITACGVNPELGGFDAGYQVVGVNYAQTYLAFCPDAGLQMPVRKMCDRALLWEASRLTDGNAALDTTGSTREGVEQDREGVTKQANLASVRHAFTVQATLTADADCRTRFAQIAAMLAPAGAGGPAHAV